MTIKRVFITGLAYLGCIIFVILLTYYIVEKDITVLFIIFAIAAIITLTSFVYYIKEKQKKTQKSESDSINISNLIYIQGEMTKEKDEQLKKKIEED